jgi:hypothetical protein
LSRSTVCTQSKASATTRVLLLCSGPIRCQLQAARAAAASAVDLLQRLLHVVLAEVARCPARSRLAHGLGALGLAHRQQRDRFRRVTPGHAHRPLSMRPFTACSRVLDARHNARSYRLERSLRSAHPHGHHPTAGLRRSRTRPPTCTCRRVCRR